MGVEIGDGSSVEATFGGASGHHRGMNARLRITWACSRRSSMVWRCIAAGAAGVSIRVQTAIEMNNVAEPFVLRRAIRHLERGTSSFLSPARAIRSSRPTRRQRCGRTDRRTSHSKSDEGGRRLRQGSREASKCHKIRSLAYCEALAKRLKIMDSTAFSLCMDNKMPIIVFDMSKPEQRPTAVRGKKVGTLVTTESKHMIRTRHFC